MRRSQAKAGQQDENEWLIFNFGLQLKLLSGVLGEKKEPSCWINTSLNSFSSENEGQLFLPIRISDLLR